MAVKRYNSRLNRMYSVQYNEVMHLQVPVYNWWCLFMHVSDCTTRLIKHLQYFIWCIRLAISFLQQFYQLSS